jgi:hypothetical protein
MLVPATPAVADYSQVATVPPDDDIGLVGGAVAVGATPKDGQSTLALYGLDGTVRPVPFSVPARFVEELAASPSGLAAITLPVGGGLVGYYGAVGGPLRRLPRTLIDIAVTGDTVVSLHRARGDRGRLELRNVLTGTLRRIDLAGERVAIVTAAGRYAAYAINFASGRETTVVVDLDTGRERYRVRTPRGSTAYGLAANGRLWFVASDGRTGRISTASRTRPRPRTVVRMAVAPYELAVASNGIAVARLNGQGHSDVVLVAQDGDASVVTPDLRGLGALAYDGTTLAFAVGACVFAGPPADPVPLALDGCYQG